MAVEVNKAVAANTPDSAAAADQQRKNDLQWVTAALQNLLPDVEATTFAQMALLSQNQVKTQQAMQKAAASGAKAQKAQAESQLVGAGMQAAVTAVGGTAGAHLGEGNAEEDREITKLNAENSQHTKFLNGNSPGVRVGANGALRDRDAVKASLKTNQERLKKLHSNKQNRISTYQQAGGVFGSVAKSGADNAATTQGANAQVDQVITQQAQTAGQTFDKLYASILKVLEEARQAVGQTYAPLVAGTRG